MKRWIIKAKHWVEDLTDLFGRRIWHADKQEAKGAEGALFATLRTLALAWKGVFANKIPNQAMALSYVSLVSLGPLIAISVMISGFVLDAEEDSEFAVRTLDQVIRFVAPPASEWARLQSDESEGKAKGKQKSEDGVVPPVLRETGPIGTEPMSEPAPVEQGVSEFETDPAEKSDPGDPVAPGVAEANEAADGTPRYNPELVDFIENLVEKSRSGTIGVFGALLLVVIAIQMLTAIEASFNTIWGVNQGRSWPQRIILYWTLISLGAVVGFAALSLASTAAIYRAFETIPFIGAELTPVVKSLAPLIAGALLALLLTVFYVFIPNTRVRFMPALIGGCVVAALLLGNNYLSFLYVSRVVRAQSLYGSIGLFIVLLIGLFIFWLMVLLGGQLTHAVQNARLLARQHLWMGSSHLTRAALCLAALIMAARRFVNCQPGITADEVTQQLKAPSNLVNQSLEQLTEMGFINPVEVNENGSSETRYRPARPLNRITLADFRDTFDQLGNNEALERIEASDPLIARFFATYRANAEADFFQLPLQDLVSEEELKSG